MNSYTGQTNMSRLIRHNCHQRSVLPVHILSAIASRRMALHRANAMITQVGFHDMPSVVWRQGRATQLVNPLSTLSLLAARRSRSGLAGYDPDPAAGRGILAGPQRLAGSLAAPRRRPSRRPGPAGARVPRSPRRPCPTLGWAPGRASVRWGGRSGAPPRQPSQYRSPARYAAGHTVHRPAGHTVRYPAGHTVRRRASPPRLPGPSPPHAARPPRRLIPRWIPAAAAASAEYGAALPSARRDNSSIYVRPGRIACALRNFLITVSTE
jgi:hypothetical protein